MRRKRKKKPKDFAKPKNKKKQNKNKSSFAKTNEEQTKFCSETKRDFARVPVRSRYGANSVSGSLGSPHRACQKRVLAFWPLERTRMERATGYRGATRASSAELRATMVLDGGFKFCFASLPRASCLGASAKKNKNRKTTRCTKYQKILRFDCSILRSSVFLLLLKC